MGHYYRQQLNVRQYGYHLFNGLVSIAKYDLSYHEQIMSEIKKG